MRKRLLTAHRSASVFRVPAVPASMSVALSLSVAEPDCSLGLCLCEFLCVSVCLGMYVLPSVSLLLVFDACFVLSLLTQWRLASHVLCHNYLGAAVKAHSTGICAQVQPFSEAGKSFRTASSATCMPFTKVLC